MATVTCMIIDDEPLSRDILRRYIAEVKELELAGECTDAMEATGVMAQQRVDLLFLDIQMPGLSGISFARSLTAAPLIIFTTAFPQYAVEGFELNAVDYLVKPYSFERFMKAVHRAMEILKQRRGTEEAPRRIMLKADRKLYAVDPFEILYMEGQGDYVRICFRERKLVVHGTLRQLEESMPAESFMRIHKSYVVNLKQISFIEGNQVRIGEYVVPVSSSQREELLKRFSSI
ncbi:MAG: LytR/AlgR family response regulator transcription factor [Bacteroidales bacterium]